MSYRVRFTPAAREDLRRLYEFQLDRDMETARSARDTIAKGLELLREFSFTCRKASTATSLLRELVIPFGNSGYVALFEIEDQNTVTILAMRHQREDDYH